MFIINILLLTYICCSQYSPTAPTDLTATLLWIYRWSFNRHSRNHNVGHLINIGRVYYALNAPNVFSNLYSSKMSTNSFGNSRYGSHYVPYRQKRVAIKCVWPDIVPIRSAEENNDAAIKFLRRYRKPDNNGTRETKPIWYVEFTSDQTNF